MLAYFLLFAKKPADAFTCKLRFGSRQALLLARGRVLSLPPFTHKIGSTFGNPTPFFLRNSMSGGSRGSEA